MLHLPQEENERCLRYLKAKWPHAYANLTVQEFERQPYYLRVWINWQAYAFENYKGIWFVKLEDATPGLDWINVMDNKEPLKNYTWRDGEYKFVQVFTLQLCKDSYGE